MAGHPELALPIAEQESDSGARLVTLALIYFSLHRRADADSATKQLEDAYASSMAYGVAEVYAWRGQNDAAVRLLERAYQQKDSSMVLLKVDPLLRSLHSDDRYLEILRRLHLSN